MAYVKKEWKAIAITLWLVVVTVLLLSINDRLGRLQAKSTKIASTLDSVESISLSTDSAIVQLSKKVDEIQGDTSYVVEKIRRR